MVDILNPNFSVTLNAPCPPNRTVLLHNRHDITVQPFHEPWIVLAIVMNLVVIRIIFALGIGIVNHMDILIRFIRIPCRDDNWHIQQDVEHGISPEQMSRFQFPHVNPLHLLLEGIAPV